ncbi:DUF423 domain-containing protein [Kangiella sp. TOML190]|uniref:DUF423 domain-containing protein n=1 Tax=Kangiella sp. TOML190 TaxID=2931351 RepID=UPI00203F7AFF|nr:DUF423 domain-containing protein [Kangiella sp. TOML190]
MNKHFVLHGAMFMALAVALGAMSSHGLAALSEHSRYLFQLGVQYQIYHAIGLLAIGIMAAQLANKPLLIAGRLMFFGIILFSGGLYFLAVTELSFLKFVIPIGGICLIASWLCIVWSIFSKSGSSE